MAGLEACEEKTAQSFPSSPRPTSAGKKHLVSRARASKWGRGRVGTLGLLIRSPFYFKGPVWKIQ